jgi:hypothetical protein
MACAAWGTAPAHAAISIDNAFFDSTLPPGWVLDGMDESGLLPPVQAMPQLMSGSSPNDGWLRLTENVNYLRNLAIYTPTFSPTEGLQITFDYTSYDSNLPTQPAGAFGIAFFLFDASAGNPSPTAIATGGTGYVGMPGAYVGIGLDEFGAFYSYQNSACGTLTAAQCRKPQRVTVRGSVQHPAEPYAVLDSVPLDTGSFSSTLGKIAPVDRANARTVRITISPASSSAAPTVTVEIDPNDGSTGFVKVIDALDLSGNGPAPANLRLGFSGATGSTWGSTHEIRIRSAKTLKALPIPALGQSTLGMLAVMLALLTVPALRSRFRN